MSKIKIASAVLLVFLLAGCAAQRAYNNGQDLYEEGKVEEGLAQMERAWRLDPDNGDYKIQYFKKRNSAVYQWLVLADDAKNRGAWDDAESYYRRILKIDPDNPRAKTYLSALAVERKHAKALDEAQAMLEKNDLSGASRKVRAVLADSPSDPRALTLRNAIDARIASSNQSSVILKSKLDHPISIEFKDAPIRAVFNSISKAAGVNFVFDKDMRPDSRVNLVVRDARIEDVIRFVLVTNDLKQRVLNQNTLFIYPDTPQKLKEFQELEVKNFYLANANAKDVATAIKGLVKTKDLYVDEKLNMIAMRDTPEAIAVAQRLISAQDIAEPEVMLDVEVLEVGTNVLDNIGVQYPSQLSYSVVGAAGTPGTLTLPELHNRNAGMVNVTISDPALIINLLHQDGDTNLLANPRIRVKNHEKATIHIGDKVPVITNTTTATGFVAQSVNYLDVGLKLDVEPTVYLENDVGIKIGLEVSSVTKQVQDASGTLAYQIGTRNANTILRLRDGETQMLAGLIDNEDRRSANRVPGLGQLPILGHLFSSESNTSTKTEVVLLITPHVIRNVVPPEAPVEEFSSGTESVIGLERMEINSADAGGAEKPETSAQALPNSPQEPKALVSAAPNPDVAVAAAASGVPPAVEAPGSVTLTMDAPPKVPAGKPFAVKLNLVAERVQNVLLNLSFDPAKLKVVGVTEGDVLKKPDGKTQFMQQVIDKTGVLNLGISRKGNVSGSGTLATITFQPLDNASGATQLRVGATNFSDARGQVLPVVNGLPAATIEIAK
jgi:general secretion pathway protein D